MAQHTICMLGGTGFVGGHLAARLVREGHRVKLLSRRRERHRDLLVLPGLSVVQADLYRRDTLVREFDGCDVVINLAGILNERGHSGRGFQRAHVELPRLVVEACKAAGIRRLLHMSALGADAGKGPSHYLRSKGEGEALVFGSGLDVTIFRPSVIFGPGDSFFNRFAGLLRYAPILFPLACHDARLAPVYVGDVAEVFVRAIDRRACIGQRYDLCGPRVYTLGELVQYTAQRLGLFRLVVGLGDGLSRLQANLLEWFPGKPFSRDNYLSLSVDNTCATPFPPIFHIKPTSVEEALPCYLKERGKS